MRWSGTSEGALAKPVIVYRLGSLGDTVVALPCFHKIAEQFSGREIIALTNVPVSAKAAPSTSILLNGGFINRAIAYPVGARNPLELLRLVLTIRATGADTLIHLQRRSTTDARRDVAFFRLCGVRTIIGAPVTPDLADWRIDPITGEEEFEAVRVARCLEPLGRIDLDDPAVWNPRLTVAEREAADAALAPLAGAPFLAVNMGGKVVSNDWGEANWGLTLAGLGKAGRLGLVFVGGPEDAGRAERLRSAWQGPVLNLCGVLAPRETAAVLGQARLFTGHDSGPLHLAAAMQTQCVGIYGGNDPARRWQPYGAGHVVLKDMRGVDRIAPERMVEAILAKLQA
jgi:heptosyltransferase III